MKRNKKGPIGMPVPNEPTTKKLIAVLYSRNGEIAMEKKISNILKELRVPIANYGFHYIRTSLKLVLQNEDWINQLTGPGGLYSEVGEVHKTTHIRVERSIRHGIECSFAKSDKETLIKYFGQADKKVTNKNFIAAIVEEIRLTEV